MMYNINLGISATEHTVLAMAAHAFAMDKATMAIIVRQPTR